MSNTYLVTGANSGLGLDSVRRLAEMADTAKVYMGCRTEQKALDAMKVLHARGIDTTKLQYVQFDASKSEEEIKKTVKLGFQESELNGLILNAGGVGNSKTGGVAAGPNHVLDVYQINVIGHIQLVEALKAFNKLANNAKLVYSGSETARGVPIMGFPAPEMGNTQEWYTERLEGKSINKKNFDPMEAYGTSKGFAALYFAEWARRNPNFMVWVVSPGAATGTNGYNVKAIPLHMRLTMPIMKPLMKLFGMFHSVEHGSARYIDTLLMKDHNYPSGSFLASKATKMTGPLILQTTIPTGEKYANPTMQKAAYEALSKYVTTV